MRRLPARAGRACRALGFCACFRNDQAVDAGQAVFTLSDATTETVSPPALGGTATRSTCSLVTRRRRARRSRGCRPRGPAQWAVRWVAVDDLSFVMGAVGDTTAPAAVGNLAAGTPTSSSLTLTWTAPGDDGSTGTASSYDIRYSHQRDQRRQLGQRHAGYRRTGPGGGGTNAEHGRQRPLGQHDLLLRDQDRRTKCPTPQRSPTVPAAPPRPRHRCDCRPQAQHAGLTAGGAIDPRFRRCHRPHGHRCSDAGIYDASERPLDAMPAASPPTPTAATSCTSSTSVRFPPVRPSTWPSCGSTTPAATAGRAMATCTWS